MRRAKITGSGADRSGTNHGKQWEAEEEEELIELYQQGLSFEEIARKLKRGPGGIRFKLIGMGIIDEY